MSQEYESLYSWIQLITPEKSESNDSQCTESASSKNVQIFMKYLAMFKEKNRIFYESNAGKSGWNCHHFH